jgi:hypothetical protein
MSEQAVDAEHDKNHRIIAKEVREVVVDSTWDLGKGGGFREP